MSTNTTIGKQILQSHGLDFDGYYFWISLGALFGFALLFNIGFIMALSYLKGNFIFFFLTMLTLECRFYNKSCYLISQLLELAPLFQMKHCLKNMEVKYPNTRLIRMKHLTVLLILSQHLMKVRIVFSFSMMRGLYHIFCS